MRRTSVYLKLNLVWLVVLLAVGVLAGFGAAGMVQPDPKTCARCEKFIEHDGWYYHDACLGFELADTIKAHDAMASASHPPPAGSAFYKQVSTEVSNANQDTGN